MLKKIVSVVAALFLLAYLLFVGFFFPERAEAVVYQRVEISITGDDRAAAVLGENDVEAQINAIDSLPKGHAIAEYDTYYVEKKLRWSNALIDKSDLYFTPSGVLQVKIRRRVPVFVLLTPEENYYVTDKRETIPCQSNESQVLPMPVVYGSVTRATAATRLYDAVRLVSQDSLWSSLFTDFYVDEKQNLFLSGPIVDFQVLFGKDQEAFPEQLDRLRLFIDGAIPKFGWAAFRQLSLIVPGQVIATPTEQYASQRRSEPNSSPSPNHNQ